MQQLIRVLTGVVVVIALPFLSACVSTRTFHEAQEKAYSQHQEDQRQILDLSVANRRLTQRVEDLEAVLHTTKEQLARTEKEWKEARDELLKLKIEKEQQPGRRRERSERPLMDAGDETRLRERIDEAKRRVKEALQQLQGILEQF